MVLLSSRVLKGRRVLIMVVVVSEAGSADRMWLKQCDRDVGMEARLIDGCNDIDVAHHCWRRQGI
jgi:hypothetical protein